MILDSSNTGCSFRIPFEAWTSFRIDPVLCCHVQEQALLWTDPPFKELFWFWYFTVS